MVGCVEVLWVEYVIWECQGRLCGMGMEGGYVRCECLDRLCGVGKEGWVVWG